MQITLERNSRLHFCRISTDSEGLQVVDENLACEQCDRPLRIYSNHSMVTIRSIEGSATCIYCGKAHGRVVIDFTMLCPGF